MIAASIFARTVIALFTASARPGGVGPVQEPVFNVHWKPANPAAARVDRRFFSDCKNETHPLGLFGVPYSGPGIPAGWLLP